MTTTGGDWAEIRQGGRFGAFMVLCLGIWLHAADSLLTTTVMPAVTAEIGGIAWVNWALALYELGSIVAGACTGLAVRAAGLGRATTLAAAAFAVGCMISALAPDMGTCWPAGWFRGWAAARWWRWRMSRWPLTDS